MLNNLKISESDPGRKLKLFLMGVLCLLSVCGTHCSAVQIYGNMNIFSDVAPTHWAASSIEKMFVNQVIKGVGDNRFEPDRNVTYAELLAMLTREFYTDRVGPQRDTWYETYLFAAADAGIIHDTAAVESPTSSINRYEMAQLLYNIIIDQGYASATGAAGSVEPNDWNVVPVRYRDAVRVCYLENIVIGRDENHSFHGDAFLTRAEAAVLMDRLMSSTSLRPYSSEGKRSTLEACVEGKTYFSPISSGEPLEVISRRLLTEVLTEQLDYDRGRTFQLKDFEIDDIHISWYESDGCWGVYPDVKISYTGEYGADGFQPNGSNFWSLYDTTDGWFVFQLANEDGRYAFRLWKELRDRMPY